MCYVNIFIYCLSSYNSQEVIDLNKFQLSKKSKTRGDDGHKVISFRIRLETLSELDQLAKKTDRSRNEVITLLLDKALEHVTVSED